MSCNGREGRPPVQRDLHDVAEQCDNALVAVAYLLR